MKSMKNLTKYLIISLVMIIIGYIAGWYFTSNNVPNQYNCYDLGNFHMDYLNKYYPDVEDTSKTALNRQLRETCFTNPSTGEIKYGNPEK